MGIIGSFQGWIDTPLYVLGRTYNSSWENISPTGFYKSYDNTSKANGEYGECSVTNHDPGSSNSIVMGRTHGMLNLTSYNYIYVYGSMWGGLYNGGKYGYAGVSSNASLTSNSFAASVSWNYNEGTNVTKVIDIRSLSGNYYFYLSAPALKHTSSDYTTVSISKIYLSQ